MNEVLAVELAAMSAEDQRMRESVPDGPMDLDAEMRWARVDVANTDRLGEIVAEYGWPGRTLVGEQGAHDAWLLAQHADKQLGAQRLFLALLRRAAHAGDADPKHLAYLTDRVAVNEGREQIYGTQVRGVEQGAVRPWPIAEPDGVDARRATVGLGPLAEYLEHMANA